jgi:hypothetical protein
MKATDIKPGRYPVAYREEGRNKPVWMVMPLTRPEGGTFEGRVHSPDGSYPYIADAYQARLAVQYIARRKGLDEAATAKMIADATGTATFSTRDVTPWNEERDEEQARLVDFSKRVGRILTILSQWATDDQLASMLQGADIKQIVLTDDDDDVLRPSGNVRVAYARIGDLVTDLDWEGGESMQIPVALLEATLRNAPDAMFRLAPEEENG